MTNMFEIEQRPLSQAALKETEDSRLVSKWPCFFRTGDNSSFWFQGKSTSTE